LPALLEAWAGTFFVFVPFMYQILEIHARDLTSL